MTTDFKTILDYWEQLKNPNLSSNFQTNSVLESLLTFLQTTKETPEILGGIAYEFELAYEDFFLCCDISTEPYISVSTELGFFPFLLCFDLKGYEFLDIEVRKAIIARLDEITHKEELWTSASV